MKVAVLIDGGFLRAAAMAASKDFNNQFIFDVSRLLVSSDEYHFRTFYYDSPQFSGKVTLPVSQRKHTFQSNNDWLDDLAKFERFAVRKGTLGFRGWRARTLPPSSAPPTDQDYAPIFEQKGVDMRIGLDIAHMSERKTVDRITLLSGDTDMVPAMKHARKAGLEVAITQLNPPALPLHGTLRAHADLTRTIVLP